MKHVALLRGINVGGKNILPMKELAKIFEAASCGDVKTFIQSGNVIFSASAAQVRKLPEQISAAIEKRFGFRVPLITRSAEDMARVCAANPFLESGIDPKWLHVYFLAAAPKAESIASLDPKRSSPDVFELREREIYLHLPNGMARTKLTNAYFDTRLATVATARNWATVCKLRELLEN